MKVIVCGGRDFSDRGRVWLALDGCQPEAVATGGATGADALAAEWCVRHRVLHTAFVADWDANGKAAGPLRNQRMLEAFNPDMVLAFPGGRGTADMVRKAKRRGVKVVEFPREP